MVLSGDELFPEVLDTAHAPKSSAGAAAAPASAASTAPKQTFFAADTPSSEALLVTYIMMSASRLKSGQSQDLVKGMTLGRSAGNKGAPFLANGEYHLSVNQKKNTLECFKKENSEMVKMQPHLVAPIYKKFADCLELTSPAQQPSSGAPPRA